jgi:hypothetical protein
MKLPRLLSPANRADAKASFRSLRMEGVQPSALGTCYDRDNCQMHGFFKNKGQLCTNCTIAQCNNLGGLAWHGTLQMHTGGTTDCWPMNEGLLLREQLGR